MKVSADSLLVVINDILDFSKIEAGKMELDQTALDLRAVVGDALKTVALRADEKNLELIKEVHPAVPAKVIGDPARLRQILLNLIGNAIKFTEEGEISVEVSVLDPAAQPARVLFAVTDTGIGVPAAKLGSIFKPFEQADGSTTRKFGGTGLGLSISTKLVSMMDGEIGVESEPGKGSRFWFILPMDVVEPAAQAADRMLNGVDVLIVDDSARSRESSPWSCASAQRSGARPTAKKRCSSSKCAFRYSSGGCADARVGRLRGGPGRKKAAAGAGDGHDAWLIEPAFGCGGVPAARD